MSTCLSFDRVAAVAASPRGRAAAAGVTVALPALALYLLTLMPDVGFWDTAEFQAIGPVLGIAHPTGFPAYTLLAWLASVVLQPFGNEALRANLLSALLGAGGVGLVAATTTLLTNRLAAGIAAGAALAVTGEAWAISLRADPHALHLFLAALLLLLLVVWSQRVAAGRPADGWLIAAAACFGVSLANHALTLLLAPGIGLFILVQPGILSRPRLVLSAAAVLTLASVALYLYLPIRSAMNPPLDYANPETWEGFRYLVLAEQFRGSFQALPDAGAALGQVIGETFHELGLVAVLALPGVLVAGFRRPPLALMLIAWFVLGWAFALGYVNAAIGRYYLVPLMAIAVLGGLGTGALLDGLESVLRARRPASQPAAAVLAAVVLIGAVLAPVPVRYGENDAASDVAARQWLTGIMDRLPADALVVSWWSYSTTLWYGKYVEGMRPDVTVIDDSTIVQQGLGDPAAVIDSYLGQRPVFLIRLARDMPQFEERYELTVVPGIPGGPVYRVEGPRSPPAGDALL